MTAVFSTIIRTSNTSFHPIHASKHITSGCHYDISNVESYFSAKVGKFLSKIYHELDEVNTDLFDDFEIVQIAREFIQP